MSQQSTRRSFFKKASLAAAGAVGFPYLIRPSAMGMNGAVAPSNRLVGAQFGCGNMGAHDLKAFLNFGSDVQMVAVCDVDDRHLANCKKMIDDKCGNQDCRTYRSPWHV